MSASASTSVETAPATPASASAAPTFAKVEASTPTGDPRKLSLGDHSFSSRAGRIFRFGMLLAPSDERLLAWIEKPTSAAGELVLLTPDGQETSLYRLPANSDIEHCAHRTTLNQVGDKVFSLSLDFTCGDSPVRQTLVVVRNESVASAGGTATGEVAVRLEAEAASPMRLSASTSDRDADGTADLILSASLRDGPQVLSPTADLLYLDRPTGFAADPAEPEASLGKHGKALLSHAVAKKETAIESARATLRFAASFCGDAGKSRVTTSAGVPKCKESRVFGDALHAMAISYDHKAELLRTVAASELAGSLKFEYGRVAQIEQLFAKKLTKVPATAKPLEVPAISKWPSAELRFDADGKLSARTSTGWATVDLAGNTDSAAAFDDPPSAATFGSGDSTVTLEGVGRSCAPPKTQLSTTARGALQQTEIELMGTGIPWALRKDSCPSSFPALSLVSLAEPKAVITVDGETVELTYGDSGVTSTAAPFSPANGSEVWAVPLLRSVIVGRGVNRERWIGKEMEGLHSCKAATDGKTVACIRDTRVVVLTRDAAKAPPKQPATKSSGPR